MLTATVAEFSVADAGIAALLGYAVVFFGLILLMIVIMILGKAFTAAEKKNQPAPVAAEPAVIVEPEKAPGSAGKLKLWGVEPKTAAIIMAIVADKLQKPINELRFLSIKEVDE